MFPWNPRTRMLLGPVNGQEPGTGMTLIMSTPQLCSPQHTWTLISTIEYCTWQKKMSTNSNHTYTSAKEEPPSLLKTQTKFPGEGNGQTWVTYQPFDQSTVAIIWKWCSDWDMCSPLLQFIVTCGQSHAVQNGQQGPHNPIMWCEKEKAARKQSFAITTQEMSP